MKKYTVNINDNINTVVEKILINGQRTVLVVEKEKTLGIISEGDILKSLVYKKNFNANLNSIMNKNFKFLKYQNFDDKDVEKIFTRHLCQIVPVLDKNLKLKEIITLEQFLKRKFKTNQK
jgi:predicted transcriptional regulator